VPERLRLELLESAARHDRSSGAELREALRIYLRSVGVGSGKAG